MYDFLGGRGGEGSLFFYVTKTFPFYFAQIKKKAFKITTENFASLLLPCRNITKMRSSISELKLVNMKYVLTGYLSLTDNRS